jgi:hypothetical protein
MSLSPGTGLGHYDVTALIGEGGIGPTLADRIAQTVTANRDTPWAARAGPGGEQVVSSGGGGEAVWSRDGSELFYRNDGQLVVVKIDAGDTWTAGTPELLFDESYVADNAGGGGGNPNYDVSPDGRQFIFVEADAPFATSRLIHVVLNWHEDLLERAPLP